MLGVRSKAGIMLCCLLLSTMWAASAASAEDAGWRFESTPYFWFISANADYTVGNFTASVDTSFKDVWENFDVVDAAARFEALGLESALHGPRLGVAFYF
jgi:hypothetical protein